MRNALGFILAQLTLLHSPLEEWKLVGDPFVNVVGGSSGKGEGCQHPQGTGNSVARGHIHTQDARSLWRSLGGFHINVFVRESL